MTQARTAARRRLAVAAAAVMLIGLFGCDSGADEPAGTTEVTVTMDETSPVQPAPRSTDPAMEPSQARREPMEELTGDEQNPTEAPPRWDAAAEDAAAERAVAFMRAFARPDLPAGEWHAGIAGFMSEQGAEMFAYVDPANVPASRVTGQAEALETSSGSLAEVHVETDAGTYLVTLTRVSAGDPWLVEYADPVE